MASLFSLQIFLHSDLVWLFGFLYTFACSTAVTWLVWRTWMSPSSSISIWLGATAELRLGPTERDTSPPAIRLRSGSMKQKPFFFWWKFRKKKWQFIVCPGGWHNQCGRDVPRSHTGPRHDLPQDQQQVVVMQKQNLWLMIFCSVSFDSSSIVQIEIRIGNFLKMKTEP